MTANCTGRRRRWRPWRRALLHTVVFVFVSALGTLSRNAAAIASGAADVETRIKAAFIYNFARLVDWPSRSGTASMRIGVLGQGEMASPLAELVRGKLTGGVPIEVAHLNSVAEADGCEMVLIERSESKHVKEIAQALAGKPVLTVCDGEGCYRDGGMIAFLIVDDSVRFQINQGAAEHAGLRISAQMLKVAVPAGARHP